jgi:nucleoside-diphosphate-sugar epimerase
MTAQGEDRSALIIGATGGVGSAAAQALLAEGWRVRALARDVDRARRGSGRLGPIEWVAGDAMAPDTVVRAAEGARLIVHAAHPAGYRDWDKLCLPMLASSITAARAGGARIVLPGSIYNYGPDAGEVLGEASPQHPLTRKGKIRVAMESMLAEGAATGVRVLVLRAGDFFGAAAPSSWFSAARVRPGKAVRFVLYPGLPEVGHAFAYLPDLAAALVRVAAIEARLPAFETVHFAGHWLERGVEMAESIRRVAGRPRAPILPFPSAVLYLAAPFSTTFREMIEMQYLWRRTLRLDNRKLVSLIGAEPHTLLDEAVRRSLEGLGCLSPRAPGDDPRRLDGSVLSV